MVLATAAGAQQYDPYLCLARSCGTHWFDGRTMYQRYQQCCRLGFAEQMAVTGTVMLPLGNVDAMGFDRMLTSV
jgi:hypothetical protein